MGLFSIIKRWLTKNPARGVYVNGHWIETGKAPIPFTIDKEYELEINRPGDYKRRLIVGKDGSARIEEVKE